MMSLVLADSRGACYLALCEAGALTRVCCPHVTTAAFVEFEVRRTEAASLLSLELNSLFLTMSASVPVFCCLLYFSAHHPVWSPCMSNG